MKKKIAIKLKNCTGCQRPVPEKQAEPYAGHRSDCPIVAEWRLEAEPVIWKIEIGSFRVRCRKTGRSFVLEAQTSLGYKRIKGEHKSPMEAFRAATRGEPEKILAKAAALALEKLEKND